MKFFKSAGTVGLEIDTGVIRVVELKGTSHSASIAVTGQIAIPEQAVVEGVVADIDTVAQALSQLWATHRISTREVVLGISNQGVFMRLAKFPKISEKKLAQALRFQAGEYFPIDLSQLVFDFSVLGEKENNGDLEILLVAARRDLLEKSLKTLANAMLQPKILDVSYLALLRNIPETQLSRTVVLADISNGLTTLQVVSRGIPRFSRVISLSLLSYAREVNVSLVEEVLTSMPLVAATREDDLPSYPGLVPEDWGTTLVNEIRSSVNYYLAQGYAEKIDAVVLSGRGACITGLPERIQKELEVPVEVLSPFKNLSPLVQAQDFNTVQVGPEFAVSMGLALRGLGA